MQLDQQCPECGKTTACYGCIMDLYRADIDHDTYGAKGQPKPYYDIWTGQVEE